MTRPASSTATRYRMPAFWQVLVAGYMILGRTFAYVGVPPVFIGEVFIARAVLQNHRRWIQRLIDDLFHLRMIATSVVLVIGWGVFEVLRAYYGGKTPIFEAIKTFAFNYYAIVLPIGVAMGADMGVGDFIRFWRRLCLFYGMMMLGFPIFVEYTLPWNEQVPLFAGPALASVVPVSILALWPYFKDWKWKYPTLVLAMMPVFFNPSRGVLLGLVLGLMCVALVSVHRVMVVTAVMGGMFLLASIVGPYLPALPGRGAQNLDPIFGIARVVSTVSEDAAIKMLKDAGYPNEAQEMEIAAGTASWRKQIWESALDSLNTFRLQLLGQGHGADMSANMPQGEDVRTPHNFVIYALFYTGAIGLGVFGLMLSAIVIRGYFIPDRNLRAFHLAMVAMTTLAALVGNMFETPFGAIPFYLITGVLLGLDYRRPRAGGYVMVVQSPPLARNSE